MKEPRAHTLDIPFRHAGMRYDADNSAPVHVGGMAYTVHHGYLVPHYDRAEKDDANHRREKLVAKRIKRFFYTAEPGLDIPLTRAQLAERMDDYEACPIPALHKIKGRLLVGAMVNRMGRLAEAMLHKNIDHADLELEPALPPYGLSDEQVAECKKEFMTYYGYLVFDGSHDPIRFVRMRDWSMDHDGVLFDLVREIGKPIATPESKLQEDIRLKIGFAMDGIDEVHGLAKRIAANGTMKSALDKACEKAVGPVHNDDGSRMNVSGSTRYGAMVQELADLCRARAGIAADDCENFLAVRERIDYLDSVLFKVHKELKTIGRLHGFAPVARGEHLLWDSLNLMRDMSNARLPYNHHSLDVYANETHPERDNSSAGMLKASIEKWEQQRDLGRGAS